jgi:hypothetical protein
LTQDPDDNKPRGYGDAVSADYGDYTVTGNQRRLQTANSGSRRSSCAFVSRAIPAR